MQLFGIANPFKYCDELQYPPKRAQMRIRKKVDIEFNQRLMKKKSIVKTHNVSDKELDRAFVNSFLSPELDDHISLEDDSYFEKIYGKERWTERCEEHKKKTEEEKRKLGLV